jgi:F-box and WD-40 domain protein CDC4
VKFDKDHVIIGSINSSITVYNTNGQLLQTLLGHTNEIGTINFCENQIVSGSEDYTVRVWDTNRWECTNVFIGHTDAICCLQVHHSLLSSGTLFFIIFRYIILYYLQVHHSLLSSGTLFIIPK